MNRFILIFLVCMASMAAYGMEGYVVNTQGHRISGISVALKGTSYSAITAADGKWSFNVVSANRATGTPSGQRISLGETAVALDLALAGTVSLEWMGLNGKMMGTVFSGKLTQGVHSIALTSVPKVPCLLKVGIPGYTRLFLYPSSASAGPSAATEHASVLAKSTLGTDTLVIGYQDVEIGQIPLESPDLSVVPDIVLASVVPKVFPENSAQAIYSGSLYILPLTPFKLELEYDALLWRPLWLHIGESKVAITGDRIETSLSQASDGVAVEMATRQQTIVFPDIATATYGDAAKLYSVTSNSALAVTVSSETPLVCSISNGELKILDVGTCNLKATQSGNAWYNATTVTKNITVKPRPITVAPIAGHTKTYDGTTATTLKLNTDYTLAGLVTGDDVDISIVSLAYNDANVPSASRIDFDYSATLLGTQAYRYEIQAGKSSLAATIQKAEPSVLAWPTSSSITYGQSLAASSLTGGSGAGTFAWRESGYKPLAGVSSYDVLFSPTDGDNFYRLVQPVPLQIAKAEQTIFLKWWYHYFTTRYSGYSASAVTTHTYIISDHVISQYVNSNSEPNGDDVIAYSSSGLPLTFTASPSYACTISDYELTFGDLVNRDATCTLAAIQKGDDNYKPAVATLDFNVAGIFMLDIPATNVEILVLQEDVLSISIDDAISTTTSSIVYVGSTFSVSGIANSLLPVTITSLTPALCSVIGSVGNYQVVAGNTAGTCTLSFTTPGSGYWKAVSTTGSFLIVEHILQSYRIIEG